MALVFAACEIGCGTSSTCRAGASPDWMPAPFLGGDVLFSNATGKDCSSAIAVTGTVQRCAGSWCTSSKYGPGHRFSSTVFYLEYMWTWVRHPHAKLLAFSRENCGARQLDRFELVTSDGETAQMYFDASDLRSQPTESESDPHVSFFNGADVQFENAPGLSCETAIVISGTFKDTGQLVISPEIQVPAPIYHLETAWIWTKHPYFSTIKVERIRCKDRQLERHEIEDQNGSRRTFYFDSGRLTPQRDAS